jgi:hypothetical protein
MKNWNGILRVLEVSHLAKDGSTLYREENLHNTIHVTGEELILKILFAGQSIPVNYYVGLDFRSTISRSQVIGDVFGWEPSINAYSRQAVASNNFSIVTASSGNRQANSPTLLFRAAGGSWGPVRNIFLTTALGFGTNSVLISSVPLSTSITVADGEIVTMRMAMALSSC